MLYELMASFTTSCPQYVRRMEYLYQAIALRGRYQRRCASWQPHLDKTKKFILDAAGTCRDRNKVVVLGSGLLLDVPIEALAEMFREVVLVDVVHLPEVRKRIKHCENVRTLEGDITGVAEKLFWNVQQGRNELPSSKPTIPEIDANTGLVISLNILSQLCTIPQDYVQKKMPDHDEWTIAEWCDQIREAHYHALKALLCDVCLIADHEYIYKDKKGDVSEQGSTVGGLSFSEPDMSWWWEIAPLGTMSRHSSKELHVGAWYIRH
jgi:hypothetical protein